jgi:hypothetical protein
VTRRPAPPLDLHSYLHGVAASNLGEFPVLTEQQTQAEVMKRDVSREEPREADIWTWMTIGVILGGLQIALWWPVIRETMLG